MKILVVSTSLAERVSYLLPNAKKVEIVTDIDILFDQLVHDSTIACALTDQKHLISSDDIKLLKTYSAIPISFTLRKDFKVSPRYEESASFIWGLFSLLAFAFTLSATITMTSTLSLNRHKSKSKGKGKKKQGTIMKFITKTMDKISSFIEKKNKKKEKDTTTEDIPLTTTEEDDSKTDDRTSYVPPQF